MNSVLTFPEHRAQADAREEECPRLEDDPEVRAHIDALQDLIRQRCGQNGDGCDLELVIRRHDKPLAPIPRVAMGGSPGDWFKYEDQMTRPKGGEQEHVWQ
jgi:hypothetical protein